MTSLLEWIHEVGTRAWLRFVQWLNWIVVSLLASVAVVHEAYPSVIAGAVGKLPPWLGIPAIVLFGGLVHYAIRRAKKSPND